RRVKADGNRGEAAMSQRMPGITVRGADMRRFDSEVRIAVDLVNRALESNWGYSPMSEGELREMASTLQYLVDPELLIIAELRGEPIAMGLTMPDLNLLIRKLWQRRGLLEVGELLARFKLTHLDAARAIACGVVQDRALFGIGSVVMYRIYQRLIA